MVNFHSFRTVGVNLQKINFGDPRRSSDINILTAVIQLCGVIWVICPSISSSLIYRFIVGCVVILFLLHYFFTMSWIVIVFIAAPLILVFGVLAKVFWSSFFKLGKSTWLTAVTNRIPLFVVFRARLINAARGAYLSLEWLSTGFHNRDIIARRGDIKQGELGGR